MARRTLRLFPGVNAGRGSAFAAGRRAAFVLPFSLLLSVPAVAGAQGQPPPFQPAQPGAGTAPTQPAPANPYDPSMQAGGLAPPAPMQGPAAGPGASSTKQELEEAKEKDSERGLEFFYVNVEGGFEHVGLTTFDADEDELTAGLIATSSSGGVIGAGAGLRLLFLTLGARARAGFFSDWQIFSAGGEIGMHIPLGNLDPHFDLGFGYAGLGNLSSAVSGASDAISIRGFYARVGGGLDYYVTPVVSFGLNASWELLGLTRPGLTLEEAQQIDATQEELLRADGTSYGSAIAITGVVGLHL